MPRRKLVWAFTALLAVAAGGVVLADGLAGVRPPVSDITWATLPAFAALIVAAECLLVGYRYDGQVDALNLVEAILAPMLLALEPRLVVVAVAAGQVLAAVIRRNDPTKAAFNVASWSFAAAVGSAITNAYLVGDAITARNVLVVVTALAVIGVLNQTSLVVVLTIVSNRPARALLADLRPVMLPGWLGGWTVNALVGLLYLCAYASHPATVLLFPVPLVVLHLAYRGQAAAVADRMRLVRLHAAANILGEPVDPLDAVGPFLESVAGTFDATSAELVLREDQLLTIHRYSTPDGYRVVHGSDGEPTIEAALIAHPAPARITVGRGEALSPVLAAAGWRDCLAAPVIDEGRIVGALLVFDQSGVDADSAGQLAVLEALARETQNAFARGRLVQTILAERLAHEQVARAEAAHRSTVEQLQQAVMPDCLTVHGAGVGVAYAASDSHAPTGGDLYDCQQLPDGTLHIAVVDVLGHGVEATKHALAVMHTLRVLAVDGTPLEELVHRADGVLASQDPELVATVVVARFDPETGVVRVVSGGHPPALLVTYGGKVTQLPALGGAIGWPNAGSEEAVTAQLEPGDSLVLYTDGLVEARKDILEGMEALVSHASEAARLPAESMAETLLDRALVGAVRRDDSLALVLRREPVSVTPTVGRWHLLPRVADVPATRHQLGRWLTDHGRSSDELLLVASELMSNAIRVARSAITVTARLDGDDVVLEVSDDGPGGDDLDRRAVAAPDSPQLLPETGRGLGLVHAVSRQLTIMSTAEGVVVTARVRTGVREVGRTRARAN